MQLLYINDSLWARIAWLQALDSIASSNLAKVPFCFFGSPFFHIPQNLSTENLLSPLPFSQSVLTPIFFPSKPPPAILLSVQRCLHSNHHHAEVAMSLAMRPMQPTLSHWDHPPLLCRDGVINLPKKKTKFPEWQESGDKNPIKCNQ